MNTLGVLRCRIWYCYMNVKVLFRMEMIWSIESEAEGEKVRGVRGC